MTTETILTRQKSDYWPELDGIRALAFLLVYVSHVGAFPGMRVPFLQPLEQAYNLIVRWGWIGVDLFLVLSGFLITCLLLKERENYGNISFKYFFVRRMLRIWPLYYLVFILGFFILPLFKVWGFGYGSQPRHEMMNTYFVPYLLFFGNLEFSHVIKSISPMVASLWTADLEEQFYVIWGGLMTLLNKKRKLVVTLITLLVVAICMRLHIQSSSTSHNPYYYHTLSHMDPLLVGSLSAIMWCTFENKIKALGPLLFIVGMSIIVSIMIYVPDIFQNQKSIVWAMSGIAIGWTCFLLGVLSCKSLQFIFSLKPLTALGKITYGMYLLHYPILVICSAFFRKHLVSLNELQSWFLIFFITLSLTLIIAQCSWKFYERPFNALRYKFSRKNREEQIDHFGSKKLLSF